MINIAVIGASGYTGAQFAALTAASSFCQLQGLYVSEQSADKSKPLSALYPQYQSINHLLQPLTIQAKEQIVNQADAVVLATDHQVSAELTAWFYQQGKTVFDLSGAYRFKQAKSYPTWYGFEHQYPELLSEAVYGLAQWHQAQIKTAKIIAVPGCYPTASILALKPLTGLLDSQVFPVINAVSGVTGAGRKASLTTSFCEVSLTPYGVLSHRHQPEIVSQLGHNVIFTPHLGNFKRGILATITVKLKANVVTEDIANAFSCYKDSSTVHVSQQNMPKVDDVVGTNQCLIGWQFDPSSGYLVLASAIDNLMKGASSQAMECIEIHFCKD